jgi:hypothetical protein
MFYWLSYKPGSAYSISAGWTIIKLGPTWGLSLSSIEGKTLLEYSYLVPNSLINEK